jgi:hypothetical protein
MSLINSEVIVRVRAVVDLSILGRTTQLVSDWTSKWEYERSYGARDQLVQAALAEVKRFERHWGPVGATITVNTETQTTTTQTYRSTRSDVTSTQKAGLLS